MENRMNILQKVKLAKAGLFVVKHFPKLALAGALSGISYYGYQFMANQEAQLKTLKEEVTELKSQNAVVIAANQAMANDMKTIKEGMETFNDRIIQINKNTQSLSKQFNSLKFQQELQNDLPQAEIDFNNWFNSYLQGINEDTHQ